MEEKEKYSVIFDETPTIYYAHHQWKYGTKIEEYELDLIKRCFPHALIVNPATDLNTDGKTEVEIMAKCLAAVERSDIVIFSSMNGIIGKGVFNELLTAECNNKKIFYMFRNCLTSEYELLYIFDSSDDRLYAYVY